MSLLEMFRQKKQPSASVAKERLQIIVAHERATRDGPDYLPNLQRDILAVVRKYIEVENDHVSVNVDNADNCSILELNVTLPG